jgi:hypothetical protein
VTYLDHGGVEVGLFISEKDAERLVSVADAMPAISKKQSLTPVSLGFSPPSLPAA